MCEIENPVGGGFWVLRPVLAVMQSLLVAEREATLI
jgi:hypothetical protein